MSFKVVDNGGIKLKAPNLRMMFPFLALFTLTWELISSVQEFTSIILLLMIEIFHTGTALGWKICSGCPL